MTNVLEAGTLTVSEAAALDTEPTAVVAPAEPKVSAQDVDPNSRATEF